MDTRTEYDYIEEMTEMSKMITRRLELLTKQQNVIAAARAFEEVLGSDCDGPLRYAFHTALEEVSST